MIGIEADTCTSNTCEGVAGESWVELRLHSEFKPSLG